MNNKATLTTSSLIVLFITVVIPFFGLGVNQSSYGFENIISFLLYGLISIAYIFGSWSMGKNFLINRGRKILFIIFNTAIALAVLFSFGPITGILQDILFYKAGIGLRYVQSRLFIFFLPTMMYLMGIGLLALGIRFIVGNQVKHQYK